MRLSGYTCTNNLVVQRTRRTQEVIGANNLTSQSGRAETENTTANSSTKGRRKVLAESVKSKQIAGTRTTAACSKQEAQR